MKAQGDPRNPRLSQIIEQASERATRRIWKMMPGRIEKWDSSKQVCDVKPLIHRLDIDADGNEIDEPLPVITEVPLVFPRSSDGDAFMSWPVKKGDKCVIQFCDRDTEAYVSGDGKDQKPESFRMHDPTDAVAYVGWYPNKKALKSVHDENIVLGFDSGSQIHVRPDGEIHLAENDASEAVALSGPVDANIQIIVDAITNAIPAPSGLDGGAALQTSMVALLQGFSNTASEKVKAK